MANHLTCPLRIILNSRGGPGPLTGIILAIGLTGSFTLLLPMLSACFAAMLVPTLLHDPPIYDSLRDLTAPEHGNILLFRGRSIDPR